MRVNCQILQQIVEIENKYIWNDIICRYNYINRKSPLTSLVCGSLLLAPIIANVLAVATVFIGLQTTFESQRRGRAYRQDKNTYAGTWAKSAGGLMQEGDVIAEFYSSSSIVPSWRGTFDQCMSAITDKYNNTNDTCSWLLYSRKYSLSKTSIKLSYPCITEIIIGINFRPCSKKNSM